MPKVTAETLTPEQARMLAKALTGERDIWDEIAACAATVLRVYDDGYAVVAIRNYEEPETYVSLGRLRPLDEIV